jgi:hypothetical protein
MMHRTRRLSDYRLLVAVNGDTLRIEKRPTNQKKNQRPGWTRNQERQIPRTTVFGMDSDEFMRIHVL